MAAAYLQIHPKDNVLVALRNLKLGTTILFQGKSFQLSSDIPAKHKFALFPFAPKEKIIMYGVLIGKATKSIQQGERLTTVNVQYATHDYSKKIKSFNWTPPNIGKWENRHFLGYHRRDGKVGTRNFWLVIPLVFCENRNIKVIQAAMSEQLGYVQAQHYSINTQLLVEQHQKGVDISTVHPKDIIKNAETIQKNRVFPNVDGIKFLTHEGGCGGIRQDSETLCRLLANYINHPNVAGATVLSLGCQNAQIELLEQAIQRINVKFDKPLYILEQQRSNSEREFIANAVKQTFLGLIQANQIMRQPATLDHLCLGLECGGSDGFSGISANPALGYTSDLLVAIGGSTILAEFPELNGVEQELINRCQDASKAQKFMDLMQSYSDKAIAVGSGFKNNPSPGNIKDGLITDAMKSAGAAKKGGTSPIQDVLDYTEMVAQNGLNLLCTPGNDVESTTGLAGAGANIIVFTTGLGTPTGNPITPVIKMSSNTSLSQRMGDIIDIDAGPIISGKASIEQLGEQLLEQIIQTASGQYLTYAERLGQDDFIPWKRGISL